MKTILNESDLSLFIVPDFIPIDVVSDEEVKVGEISYNMAEMPEKLKVVDVGDVLPRQWSPRKYFYTDGEWKFNTGWDGEDFYDVKNISRKFDRLLKVMFDKDLISAIELEKLSGEVDYI